jgi:AraC family transcriptional regulator
MANVNEPLGAAAPPTDIPWPREVTATVERRIDLEGARIEIRNYEWKSGEVHEIATDWYCFTRMLGAADPHPTYWKRPGSSPFVSFGGCWLTPPDTPMQVWREPAVLRSLIVRVEPQTFERITALEPGWYDQRLIEWVNKEGMAPAATLGDIADEMAAPGHASEPMIEALLKLFLVRFARMVMSGRQAAAAGGLGDWQLKRIRELVENSPANSLSVERLAEVCGISSRHLMRAFKSVTGLTVHGYVDQVRLDRTKLLLTDSELSLQTIAREVGFGNASHLSTVFSRKFGASPSRYRQLHKASSNRTA